jgi:hypothetical protein
MAIEICVFNSTTGLIDATTGVSSPTGSSLDAGKPVVLDSEGNLSLSTSLVTATAAVALQAGNLVNLYYTTIDSVTSVYAQLANAASASSLPAHGFVTTSADEGDSISIYTQGLVSIPYSSGFAFTDVGTLVYLSNTTGGFITKTAPQYPDLIQPLGYIYQVGVTPSDYVQLQFIPLPVVNPQSLNLQYLPCTGAVPGTVYTAPGAIVMVMYNGLPLHPTTDYTLSGTQITLISSTTSSEPSGSPIYALCFV